MARLLAVLAVFAAGPAGHAAENLGWMSLEELAGLKVTTVSRRTEPAWKAAAALSVVTGDDIRFAGVRTLGDALRLAPGLSVAQVDSRSWMVGARGFDQQFANKLLVMIDGRSVYTPLFGGVFWDAHDSVLEDVQQIEVVRGPGAAVWGANAVNGVINIVTKPATATLGTYASATVGTTEDSATLRYGAALVDGWAYRVHARAVRHGASLDLANDHAGDGWNRQQVGFRADRVLAGKPQLTLQGDGFDSRGDLVVTGAELVPPRYSFVDRDVGLRHYGGNLLARWDSADDSGIGAQFQVFGDISVRESALLFERRETIDFEAQQTQENGSHLWSWGAGYRVSGDETFSRRGVAFTPSAFTAKLFSAFAQDQVPLVPGVADLVAGVRVEHNDFTKFEIQPSLRIVWRPSEQVTVWAAVSRAVRSPTRTETAIRLDAAAFAPDALGRGSPATLIQWTGQPRVESEDLLATEVGWRFQPAPTFTVDLTAFHHDYDDLIDIVPVGPPLIRMSEDGPLALSPWDYRNSLRGRSLGLEAAVTVQPSPRQRWLAGFTWTDVEQSGSPGGLNEAYFEGSTPEQTGFVRARFSLSTTVDLELGARASASRSAVGIPAYSTWDARLGWRVRPGIEVEIRGENLADAQHPEFREGLTNRISQVRRAVFVRLSLRR